MKRKMDEGTLIMSGFDEETVLNGISVTLKPNVGLNEISNIVPDYNVELVSTKILKIVLSYINYVNQTVWKK